MANYHPKSLTPNVLGEKLRIVIEPTILDQNMTWTD